MIRFSRFAYSNFKFWKTGKRALKSESENLTNQLVFEVGLNVFRLKAHPVKVMFACY